MTNVNNHKKDKFFVLGTYLLGATALILLSKFFPSDFYLVSLLCLTVGIVTLLSAYFDTHVREVIRLGLFISGLIFFILSMFGFLLTELNFNISVYCILFGAFEIVKGIIRIFEALDVIKEKNAMSICYMISAIFDIVLGILMCIERETTIRFHINLIAYHYYFQGIFKFFNAIIESKRGIVDD